MFGYPVLDVSEWPVDLVEPEGSDEKIWLLVPATGGRALFKANVRNDDVERGDHWPEKIASELADLLHLPRARVDLAVLSGQRGCVSYDIAPRSWSLQPGYVLLEAMIGSHDPFKPEGHNLDNVQTVLTGYAHPPGFQGPTDFSAFDTFVGYLVFDALIANRDRHPANWSVLLGPVDGQQALAPTYDHATSLGFNLSDDERRRRLRAPQDWAAFLRRGTAHRFEGAKKITLVDFALQATASVHPSVGDYWLARVNDLSVDAIEQVVCAIPEAEMSEAARTFAVELMKANRKRLLDG